MAIKLSTRHQEIRKYVRRHRLLVRFVAALAMVASVLLPSGMYFIGYVPPLFPPIGYAMSVASIVVIIVTHARVRDGCDPQKGLYRLFVIFLVVSMVYVGSHAVLTIPPPGGREGPRMQTGLTLQQWSVNTETKTWIQTQINNEVDVDKQFVLLSRGAYAEGGLAGSMKVWKPWVLFACGGLLVGLFIASFMLWAFLMARLIAILRVLKLSELEDVLSIFF